MENVPFQCKICGYTYNPQADDPAGGVAPGTPFAGIDKPRWECPLCGAEKECFTALRKAAR